jgi:hypothetical protein
VCAVAWARGRKPRGAVEVPLALLGGGIVTFAASGVAGVSLLPRYLTVPAVALCLFAGWVAVELVRRLAAATSARIAGAAVVLVVVLAGVYAVAGGSVRRAASELRFVHASHVRLEAILREPAVVGGRTCGPVSLPNYRLVPDTRWILDAREHQVGARSDHPFPRGVALTIKGARAINRFGRAAGATAADNLAPTGYQQVASNQTFTASVACARRVP